MFRARRQGSRRARIEEHVRPVQAKLLAALQKDTAVGIDDVVARGAAKGGGHRGNSLLPAFYLDEHAHWRLVDRHGDVFV